ncbi:MAG TPA: tyrosine--tRNA ligase [Clostridia bacterium]|nr:tyrosine--tRNA ligase [Clostridia bacterium]
MDAQQVFERIRRDAAEIVSEETFLAKLKSGRKLKIKFGADPSRPDLHLGHTVPFKRLRLLQDAGHEIIFVIGDFTAMIGDPSGKNKTRPPLIFNQTRENGKTYFEQVVKILDPEKTTVVYNSQWHKELSFEDVLKLAGKFTLAQILERNDFSTRYQSGSPIGLHELFYPLMQGYDSVALHADVEVGGSDQTFNLLVGRSLQRGYDQEPQDVITFPLLIGLDGAEKMSKSLNNYIGLNEPAADMYQKCMRVPDALLSDYFRLTTDLTASDYAALLKEDMVKAHALYADTIVSAYCGEEEARSAKFRYASVAAGETPESLEEVILPERPKNLAEFVRLAGLASSNSDARRLIAGKGIRLDGALVEASDAALPEGDTFILKRGKNRFVRVFIRS